MGTVPLVTMDTGALVGYWVILHRHIALLVPLQLLVQAQASRHKQQRVPPAQRVPITRAESASPARQDPSAQRALPPSSSAHLAPTVQPPHRKSLAPADTSVPLDPYPSNHALQDSTAQTMSRHLVRLAHTALHCLLPQCLAQRGLFAQLVPANPQRVALDVCALPRQLRPRTALLEAIA